MNHLNRLVVLLFVSAIGIGLSTKAFAQVKPVKKDSCISGDCKNGSGMLRYTSGNEYNGEFKNGLPQGAGVMKYASGAKYDGQFDKGLKHGRGTYTYKSGNRYEGEYIQNRIEGQGTFYFQNGDRYEGHFANGDFDGSGILHYASGNKYTGTWLKNKKNGQGELTFPNGSKYFGEFKDDMFNGQGTYYFRDGSKYIGSFSNGDKHGNGVYVFRDSSRYEGEFASDAIQGKGISRYANGDRYEGEYVNGMYEGKGTYYYAQGDKYDGSFKNNLMDGTGVYTATDGITNKVTYRKGVLVRENIDISDPQKVTDTLNIETAPPSLNVDTMQSRLNNVDSVTTSLNKLSPAKQDSSVTHQPVLQQPDHQIAITDTTVDTAAIAVLETSEAANSDVKKKPEPADNVVAVAEKTEPSIIKCNVCKGTGKTYQSEIKRKRVVTKDISNGVGPKNYVTYTVDDVVRPGGYSVCSVCGGTGRKS